MYRKHKIALVIPAYNEEVLLGPTLEKVPKLIDKIYVIDDCSTDNTPHIIKKFMKKDKRLVGIKHLQNEGVGQAIITGYKKASADKNDIIVVVGGDDQMDLKDIRNFLNPLCDGVADYVKGNRFMSTKNQIFGNAFVDMPQHRFFGNSILSLITKFASGYWNIFDSHDGYTAITREAVEIIDWDKYAWKGYGYPGDWLVLLNVYNLRVKDVPRRAIYLDGERQSQIKVSKYIFKVSPIMLKKFFWRLKVKYFYRNFHPVVLCYILSMISIPLGVMIGWYIILNKILYNSITGATASLSILFLLIGAQFLLFAILFDMQLNNSLNEL